MYCAISGVTPEDPVISRKSGHVFERRLILKALAASGGKCPETGQDLGEEDLIHVKLSGEITRPAPASAASLPGLLTHMQNEWDAVILETHSVKQALAASHKELAAALYKYDAATRVIARLIKERDEARAGLASRHSVEAPNGQPPADSAQAMDGVTRGADGGSKNAGSTEHEVGKDVQTVTQGNGEGTSENGFLGISTELFGKIHARATEMTEERKGRTHDPGLASASDLKEFVETHEKQVWGENSGTAVSLRERVSAVEVIPVSNESTDELCVAGDEVVVTGSGDGVMRVFAGSSLQECGIRTLDAHVGGITCLSHSRSAHPSLLFSGGDDGFVRGWNCAALQRRPSPESPPSEKDMHEEDPRSNRRRRSSGISGVPDPVVPSVELRELESASEKLTAPVSGMAVHPCGDMVLSCLLNGRWRMHVVERGEIVGSGPVRSSENKVDSCALQPDGAVFALGLGSGAVELYDMKALGSSPKPVVTFGDVANEGEASCIAMSENGYYMVVAGRGVVRVWDLRKVKLAREARTLAGDGSPAFSGVALDWSGLFCGATTGSGSLRLFETRKLKHLTDVGVNQELEFESQKPTESSARIGIAWGENARAAYVGSLDGNLRRYGPKTG